MLAMLGTAAMATPQAPRPPGPPAENLVVAMSFWSDQARLKTNLEAFMEQRIIELAEDAVRTTKSAPEYSAKWFKKRDTVIRYYQSYFAPKNDYLFSVYRECRAMQFARKPLTQLKQIDAFLKTEAGRTFWEQSGLVDQDARGCGLDESDRLLPRGKGEVYAVLGKKAPPPPP